MNSLHTYLSTLPITLQAARCKVRAAWQRNRGEILLGLGLAVGLFLVSRYNYLLFHSLIELFSVVVAGSIFIIAWNARHVLDNDFLLFLGIAYLFVGAVDLLHTLAYNGMGVFPGDSANLATQLWIAGRYLKSISLLVSPFFLHRKIKVQWLFLAYAGLTGLLLAAIATGLFPACYVEGIGLTPFKEASEYLIILIYFAALARLASHRRQLDCRLWYLLAGSIVASAGAELAFTAYLNVYDFANLTGHYLKLLACYLLYKALVENGLQRPYALLFRDLQKERDQAHQYLQIAGVLIMVLDPQGRIQLINQRGCEILGCAEQELVGRNWFETCLPEAERARGRIVFEKVTAGQVATGERFETAVVTQAGAKRWLAFHSSVLKNETGQATGILTSGEDITERRQATQLIQAQYQQLQAQHEELLAQGQSLMAAMDETRQLNLALEQRVAGRTAELRAANAELSRVNTELTQALRAKDEFLATMSHELRTPLTAVLGLSEALQLETYGPLTEKQRQTLATIYASGQQLLALVSDILDLARVEVGKLELHLGPVTAAEVCEASVRVIDAAAKRKGLKVSVALDQGVAIIQADGRRLQQILVNLLSNAVKFTSEGGAVGLEVVGDAVLHQLRFTVWDTGIGIAPHDTVKLFKPFVQLDSRLSRRYEGTGLGLALAAGLAKLHGGCVRVESAGMPGHGSRFILELPWKLCEESASQQRAIAPAPGISAGLRLEPKEKILLVESSEPVSTALQGFLKAQGYQIDVVRESQSVLHMADTLHPAIILMDIQTPDLDDVELIRRLRAAPVESIATVPIIALTALAMPGDRERCLAAGANLCLNKPVNLSELAQAIEGLRAPSSSPLSGQGNSHERIQ